MSESKYGRPTRKREKRRKENHVFLFRSSNIIGIVSLLHLVGCSVYVSNAYIPSVSFHMNRHNDNSIINDKCMKFEVVTKRRLLTTSSSSTTSVQLFSSVLPNNQQSTDKNSKDRTYQTKDNRNSNRNSSTQQQQQQQQQLSNEQRIIKLGRTGRTDQALTTFYNIQQPDPTIREINAAIDACARARPVRLQSAMDIIDSYCISSSSERQQKNSSTFPNATKLKHRTKIRPNVYTFGALMNTISNAGKADLALKLVTKSMEDIYDVSPNTVVYNAAISACAKSRPPRPDIALQLLNHAKDQNIQLTVNGYNAACSAAANANDWKLAVQILEEMNDPPPDSVTYGTIMSACEKCNEWNKCLFYFDKMVKDAKLEPDRLSLTSALHSCQQLGLWKPAVQFLDLMRQQYTDQKKIVSTESNVSDGNMNRNLPSNYKNNKSIDYRKSLQGPDAVAYRLAISACARAGEWKECIRILKYYTEDPNQINPGQDVMAYTAAIHGCESAGEWKYAFLLLDQMRKNGAVPNEITFAAIIGACANACSSTHGSNVDSDDDEGLQYSSGTNEEMPLPLRKALQLLNVLKKDNTTIKPTILIYNAVIRACGEALDLSRAFYVFDLIKKDGGDIEPSIVTYGTLMTACERVSSTKGMDRVFRFMEEQGDMMKPNEIIYGAALSVCRKSGEAERAYHLLRTMLQDGLKPNIATFNTAIAAQTDDKSRKCDKDKNMERALIILQSLQSNKNNLNVNPNRQSYNLIIRGLNQNRQPHLAETLLQQMKHDGYQPDVDLYTGTVTSYERCGQPLQALRLMESMRTDGYDFYESSVLNNLFKKAVKVANAVGKPWVATKVLPPPESTSTDMVTGVVDETFQINTNSMDLFERKI